MPTKQQTWTERLGAARRQLLDVLQALAPAQWQTPVFSEGEPWTVTTVLAHLIDSERGMSIQVHKIRKGQETVSEGFDLNRWNAGVTKRMGEPSPEELLSLLAATRAKTLEVMSTLKDEEWALTGRHPSRGMITIEQYYETIAGHEATHAQDIQKALEDIYS
jgi:uncharacterized protein (TIGR03083 family)